MNILVISDKKSKALWDFFEPSKLDGVDLILSCGDLPPQYLSLLATFTHAPVLYVHGNHDDCYASTPPEGCICIEDKIYEYQGIRIMGLGGSMRYKKGQHQFTQEQMHRRVHRMWLKLHRSKGIDILLTHSPAFQLGDDTDLPHTGFAAFNKLLDDYQPKYFIHGHVHLSYGKFDRVRDYGPTTIINGFEQYCFEYETGNRL